MRYVSKKDWGVRHRCNCLGVELESRRRSERRWKLLRAHHQSILGNDFSKFRVREQERTSCFLPGVNDLLSAPFLPICVSPLAA